MDKCSHSCCVGWEIDVDSEALKKYNKLPEEAKSIIISSIDFSHGIPHFSLDSAQRCPHLDENGLCRIIIRHGEDYLCDICREHPRFYNETCYGTEAGLGMSCEAAAKIILESDNYDRFSLIGEIGEEREITENFDAPKERAEIYGILKDSSLGFSEKLSQIEKKYSVSPKHLECSEWRSIILDLEYLSDDHKALFACFDTKTVLPTELEKYAERALAYYVFRHCSGEDSRDGFVMSLGFALFCERLFSSLLLSSGKLDTDTAVRLAVAISEEIEYSEDNTETLRSEFF